MKRTLLLLALNAAAGMTCLLGPTPALAQAEAFAQELPQVYFSTYRPDLWPGVWLNWTASKAIRVELFDEFGELHLKDLEDQGTWMVNPTRTTKYTVRAYNCDGEYVEKSVTVTVGSNHPATHFSADDTEGGDQTDQDD